MSASQLLYSKLRGIGPLRELAAYARRRVITGYREYCPTKPIGRALVSYLVLPLLPPPRFRDRTLFSNHGIAQAIPRALNELGYEVDLINHDHPHWKPTKHYDVFIGHSWRNTERLAKLLGDETLRIYFSTGIWWREANRREAQRLLEATVRTGYLFPPERAIHSDEDPAVRACDGLIYLGNHLAGETYAWVPNMAGINNAAFPLSYDPIPGRDFERGRRGFLFFSGKGNIHKGLDVLLEAFDGLDADLHVCQDIQPDFARAYQRHLTACPNIHVHGFVPMRSPRFRQLARRCNWTISATCSEGQPGAVIECMAHGLIPVLPDQANIDVEGIGVRLPDCSPEAIRRVATDLLAWDAAKCAELADRLANVVARDYNAEKFARDFASAVRTISPPGRDRPAIRPKQDVRAREASGSHHALA